MVTKTVLSWWCAFLCQSFICMNLDVLSAQNAVIHLSQTLRKMICSNMLELFNAPFYLTACNIDITFPTEVPMNFDEALTISKGLLNHKLITSYSCICQLEFL